jgi:hypothetical protein
VYLAEPIALPGQRVAAPPRFSVHAGTLPGRARVEAFIRAVYADHYDADVRQFMPVLVSLQDEDGLVIAAAGYRSASQPLFLERYLGRPVEHSLADAAGVAVPRAAIAEVGHFASTQPGQGRRLMAHLGQHLAAAGFQWVVSTATRELRVIFERVRIRPVTLGAADPALLGPAATDWGSYYEHAPLVLAGEVRSNVARFARTA